MKKALLICSGVLWLSFVVLFFRYAHAHIAAGVLDFAQRQGMDLAPPTLWAIHALAHWQVLGACTALFSALALAAGRSCFVKSLFVVLPLAVAAVLLFCLTMPLHKWGIVA